MLLSLSDRSGWWQPRHSPPAPRESEAGRRPAANDVVPKPASTAPDPAPVAGIAVPVAETVTETVTETAAKGPGAVASLPPAAAAAAGNVQAVLPIPAARNAPVITGAVAASSAILPAARAAEEPANGNARYRALAVQADLRTQMMIQDILLAGAAEPGTDGNSVDAAADGSESRDSLASRAYDENRTSPT